MARDNAWEDQRQPIQGGGYWNTEAEYRRKGLEPPSQEGLEITEEPNWLGRMFGMKSRRFDYTTGRELGDGQTGGAASGAAQGLRPPDHPYVGQPRGMCDECGQPEIAHDDESEEDVRGPGGPEMPRPVDIPQYTAAGQVLKRFGR